jgi:hypothetical protein
MFCLINTKEKYKVNLLRYNVFQLTNLQLHLLAKFYPIPTMASTPATSGGEASKMNRNTKDFIKI